MKITTCSPSSINTYRSCNFKYYLSYILGMKTPSGKSAVLGNIVHQVFEWMAKLKKKGKTNVDPIWLFERAWDENPHKDLRRLTSS